MSQRTKTARRILEVQRHLHDLAEAKYLKIKQQIDHCAAEERDLMGALSSDGVLHGLFIDVTVKRVDALRRTAAELEPAYKKSAEDLLAQGGRMKAAERLVEDLEVEDRRVEERRDLDLILEAMLANDRASSKQDL